jgi:hypothetical protein
MSELSVARPAPSGPALGGASVPRRLSQDLFAPLSASTVDDRTAVLAAARQLPRILADIAASHHGDGPLRITDHHVQMALAPEDRGSSSPFAWSAGTARRALGLRAVRALVTGESRSPIEAVRDTIAAARTAQQAEPSTSTMDRWLTGLSPAGLAVVEAEAVTWATRLWCGLDWGAFEETPIIGRDRWWDSPHSSLLAIRSRAEVRAAVRDVVGSPFSVHLVVLGGSRRSTIRSELSVVALVEAVQAPKSLPPGRVVGWWPDSGHSVTVEVDRAALDAGVAAIARAVDLVGTVARPPFERATKAAA